MRYLISLLIFFSICSCSEGKDYYESDIPYDQRDPNLSPVTDENAPRIGDLIARGYLVVDQRDALVSCGFWCSHEGFDALYLGKETGVEKEVAEFACPGTDDKSNEWKCRALSPPYVPNSGYRPGIAISQY
jgi:hypothetical protein